MHGLDKPGNFLLIPQRLSNPAHVHGEDSLGDIHPWPYGFQELFFDFGSLEVYLRAEAGTENNTVYHDPDSLNDIRDFVLEFDRDYGFICWSAGGSNPNTVDAGTPAENGFSVVVG